MDGAEFQVASYHSADVGDLVSFFNLKVKQKSLKMDGDRFLKTDKFSKLASFMVAGCVLFLTKNVLLGNGKNNSNIQVKVSQNLVTINIFQSPVKTSNTNTTSTKNAKKAKDAETPEIFKISESPRNITSFKFQKCPLDIADFPDLTKITPKYRTRNDKYLINVSPFGPNNQLRGFRDTVLVAIYLNMTLALPLWFKHGTDPSFHWASEHKNTQFSHERIDIENLAKYLPIISYSAFENLVLPGNIEISKCKT